MKDFKSLFNEGLLTEAKQPKIVQELVAWTEVMYPEIEIIHNPNYKPFKIKKAVGETTFKVPGDYPARKAAEFIKKIKSMPKFADLNWGWSFFAHLTWPNFTDRAKMSENDFNKWSIDTRPHGSINIEQYQGVSYLYKDGKHFATYNFDREIIYTDTKNLKIFKA